MNLPQKVNHNELMEILLNVGTVRPVFIWGAPGIGKSAIVNRFAAEMGLDCVSLLGSQLAPEDIIGVPQIRDGCSEFCPPRMIARDKPYCLFLDELNACSQEVQKAFYSLILERRIGEYHLPDGSLVVGAGNRAQDNAIVKTMSSALINRMFHVELCANGRGWLEWAGQNGIHPHVMEYIALRPDHLWSQPPKTEEAFSTPRSWHMLSDALYSYGDGITERQLAVLANGCLSPHHAGQFCAFLKQVRNRYALAAILRGEQRWPSAPEDRDALYFLSQSFRAQMIKELPPDNGALSPSVRQFSLRAKALLTELSSISLEIAQMTVASREGESLPDWFLVEVVRDLPRLVQKRN